MISNTNILRSSNRCYPFVNTYHNIFVLPRFITSIIAGEKSRLASAPIYIRVIRYHSRRAQRGDLKREIDIGECF